MRSDPAKLLKKHHQLTHSEAVKVVSHVQRADGDWILNTLMIEGHNVPFQYRRQKPYKTLVGARVNLTYFPTSKNVAGIPMEIMKVVRVRRA